MTTSNAAIETTIGDEELAPSSFRPSRSRALTRGAVVLAVILAAAIAVPWLTISMKRSQVIADLEQRLSILAAGRAEVLETWLDGTERIAARVTESELFRGFATEVDAAGGDISTLIVPPGAEDGQGEGLGEAALAEQLPYMERVLADFANEAGFEAAYLFSRYGDVFSASAGAPAASIAQKRRAESLFDAGQAVYGPLREGSGGLVLDLYLPIYAAQEEAANGKIVSALLLVTPVGSRLAEAVEPPPLARPGERLRILERRDTRWLEVRPGQAEPLRPLERPDLAPVKGLIPFAERRALEGGAAVFSVGVPVAGPDWWAVQETTTAAALAPVADFRTAAILVAVLVVVTVIIAFGAFWWRMTSEHNESLARQFRHLAARIADQKQLLDSINASIVEFIGLKGLDGRYRYANPTLAQAIGRTPDEIVGLDDAALFGAGTAQRLVTLDQRALNTGVAVTSEEEIYLGSKRHHLQISKVPFRDSSDTVTGIVSVMRDVTELVEQRRKRERAVQQMVAALVRAIELRDPYLAGHSRRVAGFASEVAHRLGLDEQERATVELAANLSQIGKLAVPRDLLNKPERLSPEEIERMQQHVEHAASVLRDIDFELPVLETIYQMHERLDGGGYPRGLKGGQILRTAQILGACDVFCARIEPRSYRSGIAPEAALEVLEQNSGRYHPEIVSALRQTVESVAGEKLIAGVNGA